MSIGTLNSYNPVTMAFASAPAGTRPGHDVNVARTIHDIAPPPTYEGTGIATLDGEIYTSCKDPNSVDTIILVKGTDCPGPG